MSDNLITKRAISSEKKKKNKNILKIKKNYKKYKKKKKERKNYPSIKNKWDTVKNTQVKGFSFMKIKIVLTGILCWTGSVIDSYFKMEKKLVGNWQFQKRGFICFYFHTWWILIHANNFS